jgi:large subunit ribosomal protein L6
MTAAASTEPKQSRLGKIPVEIPKGVTVSLGDGKCDVKGPKGNLSLDYPESVSVKQEADKLIVSSSAAGSDAPRLQGLGRALLANIVKGCAEGYSKTLELHGVGYRCEQKGKTLHFALGLSHPVEYTPPDSVSAEVPKEAKGTILHLSSPDKSALGQAAATIRAFRPPEPYGGKGVRYRGEQIRRKAGKAGKK